MQMKKKKKIKNKPPCWVPYFGLGSTKPRYDQFQKLNCSLRSGSQFCLPYPSKSSSPCPSWLSKDTFTRHPPAVEVIPAEYQTVKEDDVRLRIDFHLAYH